MAGGQLSPLLLLKSPLGDDRLPVQEGTLHAVAMTAVERLSAPFEITLDTVSSKRGIDPNELLDQPVTITVRRKDGIDREFNGLVCRFESIGYDERSRWRYRLTVVPKLWFLEQSVDCRIFQKMTTKQILETIFAEHKVEPVEFLIYDSQTPRPYTTQFNETDLAFVERIMQESGYYYFFRHSDGEHELVVTDGNQAFKPQPSPLHRVIINGDNVDIFHAWSDLQATAYGRVEIQDYDPTRPARLITGRKPTRLSTPGASTRDVYRWPAMTLDTQVATDRARFRMEAAEAQSQIRSGHGHDPNICPGFRFTLEKDPATEETGVEHTVHGVTHEAVDETWVGGTAPPQFDCAFTCFKQSVTWRDDLSIPRPVMAGVYSGIVLGLPGEDIHSDDLARIKVQPKFDHRNDVNAARAIFMRVLHAWAGNGWGWQHIPRVGSEVGVSFMNGDPDNPVCVGCFYHQENMPIYPVPGQETRQGFKSRSTPGDEQTKRHNELYFDDKIEEELIYMHAQKDHQVEVEHDQTSTIGNNRSVTTNMNDSLTSTAGEITITADVGPITVSSPSKITLAVGATTITLTPEGITMTGPLVATFGIATVTINAPTVEITAEAEMTLACPTEITLATPAVIGPVMPLPVE